jgi:hypothetical protein
METIAPLLKSIKGLVDLVTIYLFVTWSSQAIEFVLRNI